VTVGAIGSHHVLATGVFARPLGIRVEAVVVPQPRTPHVVENMRADLAQGVELLPASSYAHAAYCVAMRLGSDAYYIPAGGSNRAGVSAYIDAAAELANQVRAGELPEPDALVVALGSGGTAAGLAAGVALQGMRTRVIAVTVAVPAWAVERMARWMAGSVAPDRVRRDAISRLVTDRRYLGEGYGRTTATGARALSIAAESGIDLDTTYTAKTFAGALDLVAEGRHPNVLYRHTLSSASMDPLLAGAPAEDAIDARLHGLLR
jgi:1-aminocyclopropane-1-carboxylate deaminase/D-cysteine desulfhydrase-like pyridoxal-dependent ACC family enzyme